jgi:F-type H+-transporting ATPase subunit alpha
MPVQDQVVSLFAGTKGYLDDLPVTDVARFESELLEYMRANHGGLMDELITQKIPDSLAGAVEAFKAQFASTDSIAGNSVDPTSVDADEMGDAESNKTLATE